MEPNLRYKKYLDCFNCPTRAALIMHYYEPFFLTQTPVLYGDNQNLYNITTHFSTTQYATIPACKHKLIWTLFALKNVVLCLRTDTKGQESFINYVTPVWCVILRHASFYKRLL